MGRCWAICGLVLLSGCLQYQVFEVPGACSDDADCNGPRTCGEMIPCIDWKCSPDNAYFVSCRTGCTADEDCVLVGSDCCCGGEMKALLADDLAEWWSVECASSECTPQRCSPGGWGAECHAGVCEAVPDPSWIDRCERDEDCVKVSTGCPGCGCNAGYPEKAIHRNFEDYWKRHMEDVCLGWDECAPGPHIMDVCTDRPAVCHEGRCTLLGDWCDCGPAPDFKCAEYDGEEITLLNGCQVKCLGAETVYPGRCSCRIGCLDPDPMCASNNETFWCGRMEVECSSFYVAYPGPCDERCSSCFDREFPWHPVCAIGQSGQIDTYADLCFAECQQIEVLHDGECLEGEGLACDRGDPEIPCPAEGLYCRPERACGDCTGCSCPGVCFSLGTCFTAEDCLLQKLPHDECAGGFKCESHSCVWQCY